MLLVVMAVLLNAGIAWQQQPSAPVVTGPPISPTATSPAPTPPRTAPSSPTTTSSSPTPASPTPNAATTPRPSVTPTLETLSRGIVLIKGEVGNGISTGTGMIVDASGLVVTNYHVVEGTQKVFVKVATTKDEYEAKVLGSDPTRDVALLQLQGAGGLDVVQFDPDPLAVGDPLIQVGNSGGQGYLDIAKGVVVDLNTSVTVKDELSPTGRSTLYGVVESDTAAVPGDSGGPMYDAEGQVVGMTTAGNQDNATTKGATITYHLPWPVVLTIADSVSDGNGRGTLRVGGRAYLGVTLSGTSLKVATVEDGGPADKAGLSVGAVISAINGDAVKTRAELYTVLSELRPGAKVTVVWTDAQGGQRTSQVTLGTSPTN
ncbi:S1C family serine protease [Aestuariimicrobium ganziense]|uniref:S1C family serine protease n=1 Tax=Aestuariimicrobium ganziense TaxID=2773677 RepID=UPI001940727A|nr:trypsin-like peptidase domain-containing protein [Aestuariimicrobium ganziense]